MNIFIIGVTGNTGSRVARTLIQNGDEVSGLYRRPAQADKLHGAGVIGHFGDIARISEHDLSAEMAGAESIVFTAGAGDGDDEAMIDRVDNDGVRKTAEAAELAGIDRLLLVSVFPEAGRDGKFGEAFEHYIQAKKAAEIRLVRSKLDWLILRPSSLTDERASGKVSLSPAEPHTTIARDDLALTIAALLHTPKLTRRILEVTRGEDEIAKAVEALVP